MMPGPVFGGDLFAHSSPPRPHLSSDSSHYHKLIATTPTQDEVDTHVHISPRVCSLLQVTRCLRRRCWKCTTSQHASDPSIAINVEIHTARTSYDTKLCRYEGCQFQWANPSSSLVQPARHMHLFAPCSRRSRP